CRGPARDLRAAAADNGPTEILLPFQAPGRVIFAELMQLRPSPAVRSSRQPVLRRLLPPGRDRAASDRPSEVGYTLAIARRTDSALSRGCRTKGVRPAGFVECGD